MKDNSAIAYEIEVNYQQGEKVWTAERTFGEFECMQKLLVEKYLSTPYLPSKVLMKLKESEKMERKHHLQTYLRVCLRSREIFNAIEFRVFLELEKNLQIYIDTLEQIRDISTSSKPVLGSLL